MDKGLLSQWVEVASQVCGLDSARETATKHKGLCSLQAAMHKELGAALNDCLNDVLATDKGKMKLTYYLDNIDICLWQNTTYNRSKDLLINHLPEIEEWEKDNDEMEGDRYFKLSQYKYTYVDTLEVKRYYTQIGKNGSSKRMEERVPHPDSIYCNDGLYRKYIELRLTDEYKLLRALQAYSHSYDDLELLYKAVWLYVSLLNEKAAVEAVAEMIGIHLPETAPELPQNEKNTQGGVIAHPEPETAPVAKLQRFLECVPVQSKKNAEKLLQRVIKAGYCNENYKWDASKWKPDKSRLALACFVYLASNYLDLSQHIRDGKPTTNWQAFERLLEYDGKKADKYGAYHQLADVKKQQCKYDEQERFYQCPEMIKIKKLFNN